MFRSFLFVPGDRPERFDKAVASGADAVCIDLEDAVSATMKPLARREALAYISDPARKPAVVGLRINALDRLDGHRDLVALGESAARPAFVLLPKVRAPETIEEVRRTLGDAAPPVWALMETPEALAGVGAVARAVGEEAGIVFGGADLSAALGADMNWDAFYYARAALVAGAALAGCQTLDVPHLDVRDRAGLAAETRRVKAMGFTGRSCIHPDQVATINEVFTPTADEIEKARAVIAAYDANAGRVLLVEGRLVEKPVLAAARRVLARAPD
jgi:citrate lyase subunit beta/citryl-CoA lyase/(S)-citramalyl-CoA lyase